MKIKRLHTHILIRLAILALIFGISWGATRTDSFFVYSQADMMHYLSCSTDGFVDSAPAELSAVKVRQVEMIHSKGSAYRNYLSYGMGEHVILDSIFHCLFHSKQQGRDVFAESYVVGLLCSSLIVKYVHQTDGEKG